MLKRLFDRVIGPVADEDKRQARVRIDLVRAQHSDESPDQIAERLIARKCVQAGAVGAITSVGAALPGLGTAASLTLGMAADRAMTAKLHGELFLEMLELYEHKLSLEDERNALLLVTSVGAGVGQTLEAVGTRLASAASSGFAGRTIGRALPVVSIASATGMNVALTYVVGRRAQALAQQRDLTSMSLPDTVRMLTGLDERKLVGFIRDAAYAALALVSERVVAATDTAFKIVRGAGGLVALAIRPSRFAGGETDELDVPVGPKSKAKSKTSTKAALRPTKPAVKGGKAAAEPATAMARAPKAARAASSQGAAAPDGGRHDKQSRGKSATGAAKANALQSPKARSRKPRA